MEKLAFFIGALIDGVGKAVAWLCLLMALVQIFVIGLLYFFSIGSLALQESILYMNGTMFMLAMAWSFKHDEHVRVDLLYGAMSEKKRAQVNFYGVLFFLFPLCGVLLWASVPYAGQAWSILEGSRETGGLPVLFLLKTIIPVAAALLAAAGIAHATQQLPLLKK